MHWTDRLMRRPAINTSGDAHGLTFTCYHRYPFLTAERTCLWLCDSLNKARKCRDFLLWAYVFMPEHVHLVVHPRVMPHDMFKILQTIKQPVGSRAIRHLRQHSPHWLPRLAVKAGKRMRYLFWQPGGGFDRNETEPVVILAMIDPVRRGLVARAEDWKWSSAGWLEGKNPLRPDPLDFGGAALFVGGRG